MEPTPLYQAVSLPVRRSMNSCPSTIRVSTVCSRRFSFVGSYFYARFFASKPKKAQTTTAKPAPLPVPAPTTTAAPVKSSAQPAKPKRPGAPPEAAYIWSLSEQAKPQLAGVMDMSGGEFSTLVEWRADQSPVLDRLPVEQIRALGVMVERRAYGLRLTRGQVKDRQIIVVTAWPVRGRSRVS